MQKPRRPFAHHLQATRLARPALVDGASQLLTGAELEQGGALSCRQIEGRVTEPSPGARGQPAKNAGERDPPGPTRVPPRCRGPTRPRAGAGATSEIQGIGERSGCRVPHIRGKREWRRQLKRTEERPSSSRLSTGPTVRRSTPLAGGKTGSRNVPTTGPKAVGNCALSRTGQWCAAPTRHPTTRTSRPAAGRQGRDSR